MRIQKHKCMESSMKLYSKIDKQLTIRLAILKENLGTLHNLTNHIFELQYVIVIPARVMRIPNGKTAE